MFAARTQPCVDLERLRWQAAQAHGLRGADAGGLDAGVLAVHDVDVLRVVAAGNALDPGIGDVRAGDRVPPAGLLLVGGEVAHLPAGRLDAADDPAQAAGPVLRPGSSGR